MKQWISMALAVLMLMLLTMTGAGATSISLEQQFDNDYYEIYVPANFEIDTSEAKDEENYHFIAYLMEDSDEGLVMESAACYYESMADVSLLYGMDEDVYQNYVDEILEIFEEDKPEYIGFCMAGMQLFAMFKCEDETGPYLYAETMCNGMEIHFYGYWNDASFEYTTEITSDRQTLFELILASFYPHV